MNSPLLTLDGLQFLLRWLHIYFGVIWIGTLYYFNYMQGSFMKEAAAPAKPEVLGKLLPRAMWWFRWGALWTLVTGTVLILISRVQIGSFNNSWGVTIGTGAIMGLIMGANVWFVIWPAQQVVIQNAQETAAGRAAVPGAAEAGARALLASRTNAFLSIPMLYFMAASRHLNFPLDDTHRYSLYWAVTLIILAGIEVNALKGKLGPLETVKGVITCGFIFTLLQTVIITWVL